MYLAMEDPLNLDLLQSSLDWFADTSTEINYTDLMEADFEEYVSEGDKGSISDSPNPVGHDFAHSSFTSKVRLVFLNLRKKEYSHIKFS